MNPVHCPSREQLAGYAHGDLPEDSFEVVAAHVEACPACEATVESLEGKPDTVIEALRQPTTDHTYADEAACQAAVERIQQINGERRGVNPTCHEESGLRPDNTSGLRRDARQIRVYRLLHKLGEGGMGAVYQALHTELDKVVALKVLSARRMDDRNAVARFKREMKAVGKLEHPNIVRALDAGEENGTHYLVMEFVPGCDAAKIVDALGPLPIADACEIVRQAALGLQHAHEHRLVHRDLKPSNLLLSAEYSVQSTAASRSSPPDDCEPGSHSASSAAAHSVPSSQHSPTQGQQDCAAAPAPSVLRTQYSPASTVKIADFGLALLADRHAETTTSELTGESQVMGTLDYMAPEQGSSTHHVDIRADIYSLGATLYKLLCGEAPFAAKQYATILQKVMALATEPVPPVQARRAAALASGGRKPPDDSSDIPDALAALVHRLLDKNPAARPQAPADVAAALTPFCRGAFLPGLLQRSQATEPSTTEGIASPSTLDQSSASSASDARAVAGSPLGVVPKRAVAGSPDAATARGDRATAPGRIRRLVALSLAAAAIVAGVVVLRIATDQGELTITTAEAGVAVTIKRNGKPVQDLTLTHDKTTTSVYAGTIEVVITGANADSFEIKKNRIVMSRGDKKVVEIERKQAETGGADRRNTDPDRRAAEWVLSLGGELEILVDGGGKLVTAAGQVPAGPFTLSNIELSTSRARAIDDAALDKLRGISNGVQRLALRGQPITDAGVQRLASFTGLAELPVLDLFGTKVTDAGVRHLTAFRKLRNLDICAGGVTDAGMEALKGLPELGLLVLPPSITGAGLKPLRDLPALTALIVYAPKVTGGDLAHLGGMKLRVLLLRYMPQVGDEGMDHLSQLSTLTRLDLEGTPVGDAGLARLQALKGLEGLGLTNTKVTAAGVAALQKALPNCKIDWDGGVIDPAVGIDPDRRAAEWVLAKRGHVRIAGRPGEIATVAELPAGAFKVSHVRINLPIPNEAELAVLSPLTSLVDVRLDATATSDAGLVHLKNLKALANLNLTYTQVSDAGMAQLKDLPKLAELRLAGTRVGDAGAEALKNLPSLTLLNMGHTRLGDRGLEHLKALPALQQLVIHATSITDAGLAHLQGLAKLKNLGLQGTQVSDAGLVHLYGLQGLETVDVRGTRVTAAGVAALQKALPKCKVSWDGTGQRAQ